MSGVSGSEIHVAIDHGMVALIDPNPSDVRLLTATDANRLAVTIARATKQIEKEDSNA